MLNGVRGVPLFGQVNELPGNRGSRSSEPLFIPDCDSDPERCKSQTESELQQESGQDDQVIGQDAGMDVL